ncbi:hypothetical protein phiCbK_168 [Caulobacter phage phiCbK]|uniref:Uncharacterized protein n=5 Tax=Viruses TaxID=10239 RepID=J3U9L0_9CAUD|nr:hypothetical protein D865_gp265 [Caulobacter phage phiCbK]AFO71683.1 hypothetical protein phiCbK_168 [Caulobacter phage phiCbK]AFU86985.1 hypothetical protein CbK_gp153 [Caulobacter phage phiCbK]ARB15067.1 hypothetical protein Ccr32_gp149 [Caulobacter phage Ccr32]ARB15401.1 hypothetical protein Ccr34_gp159 [Caulobacter phage Ccr34]
MISLSSASAPPEPDFLSNLGLGGKTARPPETAIAQMIAPTGKALEALTKLRDAYAKPLFPTDTLDAVFPLDNSLPLSKMAQTVAALDGKIGKMILAVDPASPSGGVSATTWKDLKIIEDTTLGLGDLLVAPRKAGKSRLQQIVAQMHKSEAVITQNMAKAFAPYPYQKYAMDWLSGQYYEKTINMIEPYSGGRYNDALRRYERHVHEMAHRCAEVAHYLPDSEPRLRYVRPEIAQLFIWGPKGEWTGYWVPDKQTLGRANDRRDRLVELGYALRLNNNLSLIRGGGGGRDYHYRGPNANPFDYVGDPNLAFEDYPEHYRFADYDDWSAFEYEVMSNRNPASESTRRLAQHLSALNIEPTVLLEWTAMLGKAKFGYGVLRDGRNRCDAFGVLATINNAAWTWDAQEGAWAIDGSCYDVKPERLAEWLGIRPQGAGSLEPFFDDITHLSDGATSFKPLVEALNAAGAHAASTREAYREFLEEARRVHGRHRYSDLLRPNVLGARRVDYDYITQSRVHDEIMLEKVNLHERQTSAAGFTDMEEDVLDPEIFGDEA